MITEDVSMLENKSRRGRMTALRAAAAVATLAITAAWPAQGQDKVPGLTGVDRPDEVIQARQLVMDGIESEMGGIELGLDGKQPQLDDMKARADRISTLLTAFAHLFPPQTKPGPAADGTPSPTTATPAIWQDFDAFYGKVQAAAKTAYDASVASALDQFRAEAKQLRVACDGCHAQYMHVEGPQK
jgi:cytochrome c556